MDGWWRNADAAVWISQNLSAPAFGIGRHAPSVNSMELGRLNGTYAFVWVNEIVAMRWIVKDSSEKEWGTAIS